MCFSSPDVLLIRKKILIQFCKQPMTHDVDKIISCISARQFYARSSSRGRSNGIGNEKSNWVDCSECQEEAWRGTTAFENVSWRLTSIDVYWLIESLHCHVTCMLWKILKELLKGRYRWIENLTDAWCLGAWCLGAWCEFLNNLFNIYYYFHLNHFTDGFYWNWISFYWNNFTK